jgi:hypothetical protein
MYSRSVGVWFVVCCGLFGAAACGKGAGYYRLPDAEDPNGHPDSSVADSTASLDAAPHDGTSTPDVSAPDVTEAQPDTSVPACTEPSQLCGTACVNTNTSVLHCGDCGHACGNEFSACVGGVCQLACASPRTMCPAGCVDTRSDVTNCGACGNRCTTGQSCVSGVCQTPCALPMRMCGASCIDVTSNLANCGTCGFACSSGQSCTGGTCVSAPVCPGAITVTTSTTVTGTTSGVSNFAPPAACITATTPPAHTAPEAIYRIVPVRSGTIRVSSCNASTTFDTMLYYSTSCAAPTSATQCNDDDAACTASSTTRSTLSWTATAGVPYFLFVDGYGDAVGSYAVTITLP